MATTSYRVGALPVKTATPPLSVKAGVHRPRLLVTVRRIPKHHGQHVPLTCVPTAFWNAAAMAGHPVDLDAIGQAKRYTGMGCRTEMPVFAINLGAAAPNISVRSIWVKERGDRTRHTLREAVARLKGDGYTTGVIATRTPNHACAIQIAGAGVHVVDNGGFKGIATWQGSNIRQLYGVQGRSQPGAVAEDRENAGSKAVGRSTAVAAKDTRRLSDVSEAEVLDIIEREVQQTYSDKMAAIALSRRALADGKKIHYPHPDPVEGWDKTSCGLPLSTSYVVENVGQEWVTCNSCLRICG